MIGGKQECLDRIERYTQAGVTHFIFMSVRPWVPDEISRYAEEVIAAVRAC